MASCHARGDRISLQEQHLGIGQTTTKQEDCWMQMGLQEERGILGVEDARYKARLVAKGYSQVHGIDFNDIFSPVVNHNSIHVLLALVAMYDLELEHLDVKTAFLQGELEEKIYMQQHEGFEVEGKKDHICLLKKSLYSLKQSPRL